MRQRRLRASTAVWHVCTHSSFVTRRNHVLIAYQNTTIRSAVGTSILRCLTASSREVAHIGGCQALIHHDRLATSLNTSTTLRHLLQDLDLHPVCGPVRASTVVQLCNCIGLHTARAQMLRTAVTWFQSMSRQQNEFICSRDFAYVVKQGPFGAPPGHRLLPCQRDRNDSRALKLQMPRHVKWCDNFRIDTVKATRFVSLVHCYPCVPSQRARISCLPFDKFDAARPSRGNITQ